MTHPTQLFEGDPGPIVGGLVIENTRAPDTFAIFAEQNNTEHDFWIEAAEDSYVALEDVR